MFDVGCQGGFEVGRGGCDQPPRFDRQEIDVWLAPRGVASSQEVGTAWAVLTAEERHRAGQFRFEADRRRYIQSRGCLRFILARYTGEPAEALVIQADSRGKPYLHRSVAPFVQFNLAHGGQHTLMAISRDLPLGVDFEDCGQEDRLLESASAFCSASELRGVARLARPEQPRALLRLWTAKEAFLKALGTGLLVDPRQIEVPASVAFGHARASAVVWRDSPVVSEGQMLYPLPGFEWYCGASAALVAPRSTRPPLLRWRGVAGVGPPQPP